MITDFHIDEVQDYFEHKSELHKIVRHNKEVVAGAGLQRTFARFESEEHIRQIQNNAGKEIVVVSDYFAQRVGDPEDYSILNTIQLRFAVKKESGGGDETNAINEAIKKAEQIMFDYMTQMEKDYNEGCNSLEGLQPEKISWNKIDEQPWLDDYYGWDLNVPFKCYMPEYNAENWEEDV